MRLRHFIFVCLSLPASSFVAQQGAASFTSRELFARTQAATVVILAGEGAGRLHSLGTGVAVAKDGVILTALHVVKGAAEVQVRLPGGDVYDHVEMIGSDERRDVAALKISAANLATLTEGNSATLAVGDPIFAVSNPNGLAWSATEGILSASRPAEEVAGAGSGFRLLQFTAPVAPGSSGGALVYRSGALVGIITSSKGAMAFAIPIENIAGLPSSGDHVRFGSGAMLQMPARAAADVPQSSAAIAGTDPMQLLRQAKTVAIRSKTMFLTVDTLDRALAQNKAWASFGIAIVQDARVADLLIELDRPLFTYVHTFVIVDKRTSLILGSGKVTAFDGTIASPELAKDIAAIFTKARTPPAAGPPKN